MNASKQDLVNATIQHMATIAGMSFLEMAILVKTDAAARARFVEYMGVAYDALRARAA